MKRSPQGNRVETNEVLKFCRVNDAELVNDSSPVDQQAGAIKLGSVYVASMTATGIRLKTTLKRC